MKIRTDNVWSVIWRDGRIQFRYALLGALVLMVTATVAQQDNLRAQQVTINFKPLLQVLDAYKLRGSIEFKSRCTANHFPGDPGLKPHSPALQGALLQTVRDMFEKDANVRVNRDSGGIVRMIQTEVPTDLLRVRIRHIVFEDLAGNNIYNPNIAVQAILGTPEVVLFMKQHSIQIPSGPMSVPGGTGHGAQNWPRLNGSLDNVTVREALDHVLQTFGGIWIYQACPESSMVYIHFYYLRKLGSIVIVQS